MIVHFKTEELKSLFETPLDEIRGKRKIPTEVIKKYKQRILTLFETTRLDELRGHRGLNFEFLKGERKGQCSIRLKDQYRLILTPMDEQRIQVVLINEISKHYDD